MGKILFVKGERDVKDFPKLKKKWFSPLHFYEFNFYIFYVDYKSYKS